MTLPTPRRRKKQNPIFFLTPILFAILLAVHSLTTQSNHGLLFLTPRTGGFNNQLITIYEGIYCALQHGRTVVLPLIYENVRADTSSKGFGPYPFEDYFDIEALKSVVSVTTPALIDKLGIPCYTIYFATSSHFKANARRVPRLLKQQYSKRWSINHTFVEEFQHPVRDVCVDDSLCKKADFHIFGAYSDYEKSGQGFSIRNSPQLLQIRSAFKPSKTVKAISESIMDYIQHKYGKEYNALHLRRGDFADKCEELPKVCEQFGEYSIVQSREWVLQKLSLLRDKGLPLFISTTHRDECVNLLSGTGLRMVFMEDVQLPPDLLWVLKRTDLISFASQIVASRAKGFIGNRFSSYTTEINNMRYLRDKTDKLLFF